MIKSRRGVSTHEALDRGLGTWPDTGCSLCPSCLSCVLPECVYDRGRGQVRSEARALEVRRLVAAGATVREAAAAVGVQRRQAYRLGRARREAS